MTATAPTNASLSDEQLADLESRRERLAKLAASALKALQLQYAHPMPEGVTNTKPNLVIELSKNDDIMRHVGHPIAGDAKASTGDVDADGEIIGEVIAPLTAPPAPEWDRASVTVDIDAEGFPVNGDDLVKLTAEHLTYLRWVMIHQDEVDNPGELDRDGLAAWIERTAYQVPGQTTIDDAIGVNTLDGSDPTVAAAVADAAHIPVASTPPTTICACNGNGGFQTDAGWEPCTNCSIEADGQLTLVPGGDKPAKSVLNVGALRHDLGTALQFHDGDRVRITFEVDIEKIAFIPEKSGGESKRRVRTHAGPIDLESVIVEIVGA